MSPLMGIHIDLRLRGSMKWPQSPRRNS